MKKTQWFILFLLGTFVTLQGVATAKTVSGTVSGIDQAGNKLSIGYTDPATSKEEKVDISVNDKTTYSGIAALAELKEGQAVSVEAEEVDGALSATSVNLAELPALEEEPAAPIAPEAPAEPAKGPAM